MTTCLEQLEKCGENRQKVNADTSTSHASEIVSHFSGKVHRAVQMWELEKIELLAEVTQSNSGEDRNKKYFVVRTDQNALLELPV